MKLSRHTAKASLRPISSEPTRCSIESDASSGRIVILSCNLAILVCGRLTCAPLGDSSRMHQPRRLSGSSFAFPGLRRFHIRSCHSTPGRRGHIRRVSAGLGFFGLLNAALSTLPCGWVTTTPWPKCATFPCSASDTGGFRSALLHRQYFEFAPGHVRQPGLDCVPFWLEPYSAPSGSLL